MRRRTRVTCALAALLLTGGSASAASLRPDQIASWDASHHVVHLTLLAGLGGGNNGFNFDGYGRGELLITVPIGSRIVVDCENRGGRKASCAIVRGSLATVPSFRGAASPRPLLGLDPGAKATFAFRATRAGSFRITSLVAGEEPARMFAVLDVKHVRRPTVSVRPGP